MPPILPVPVPGPCTWTRWPGWVFPSARDCPGPNLRYSDSSQLLETPVLHAEAVYWTRLIIVAGRLIESEISLACRELGRQPMVWVNWGNLELRLVGLLDANLLALGLGLLLPSPWERRQIILHTPLPSRLLARVKFCRLGKIRLDLTGEELPLP